MVLVVVAVLEESAHCVLMAPQHHGIVRVGGAGDREVRQGVLQRDQSLHHVRGAALCRPHPQTLHRHLPGTQSR